MRTLTILIEDEQATKMEKTRSLINKGLRSKCSNSVLGSTISYEFDSLATSLQTLTMPFQKLFSSSA